MMNERQQELYGKGLRIENDDAQYGAEQQLFNEIRAHHQHKMQQDIILAMGSLTGFSRSIMGYLDTVLQDPELFFELAHLIKTTQSKLVNFVETVYEASSKVYDYDEELMNKELKSKWLFVCYKPRSTPADNFEGGICFEEPSLPEDWTYYKISFDWIL